MARTLDPKDVQGKLDEALGASESLRQHTLAQLAADEDEDAAILQDLRADLVREVGDDDPRVRALDRRLAGAKRFADFARGTGTTPEPDKPAIPGDWRVTGRVLDANEKPVAGALVTLTSSDQDLVHRFGETRTGADGRFEVHFAGKDFADVFKRAPKARVVVVSPDGKLTHTTHEIQPAGDKIDTFDIRLRPVKPKKAPVKKAK